MEKLFNERTYQRLKNIYHLIRAIGANVWFGFPSRKIKIIGVTGTNGKTTTVLMIGKILEEAGYKVAINSTIKYKIGEKEWVNKTKFTTVSSWFLQEFIKRTIREKCDYLILEISSHALDQNRAWGVNCSVAVITNITREHLDYHRTMEEYKNAKLKLFNKRNFLGEKNIVVNLAMKWAGQFLSIDADKKYGYSLEGLNDKSKQANNFIEIIPSEAKDGERGSVFSIHDVDFNLNLTGDFNVENALAATCVGLSQDVRLEKCADALKKIKKIPGRMDYVMNDLGVNIIIDYALTPDSMEKIGKLMKKKRLKDEKLIWIFGACGQRDRGKRPIMGGVVSRYSDYAIVTNEDPYEEDPDKILDEILEGMKEGLEMGKVFRILKRKEAIRKALTLARKGDYILITGKGAEETMAIGGNRKIKWNDLSMINKVIKERRVSN